MTNRRFVFLDHNGRRWRWVRVGVALAVLALLILAVVFLRALWVKPELRMPESLRTMKTELKALSQNPAPRQMSSDWLKYQNPQPRKVSARALAHPRIAAALVSGWDPRSIQSLTLHSPSLTHICPEMLVVEGQPAELHSDIEPETLSAIEESHLKIVPLLTNLSGSQWDTDAVEGLLRANRTDQETFFAKVDKALDGIDAAGVLVDFQGIDPVLSGDLASFLASLRETLHKNGRQLWLSIPVGDDLKAFDLDRLPKSVDFLVAQLHDENAEDDAPGPVASRPWFEGWLRTVLSYGEPGQWILSLGSYGYDWNKATGKAVQIGFPDIMARAGRAGVEPITSSAPDYNPGFGYDREGEAHEVSFLDAATFGNQLNAADRENCAGILINRLGSEDPGIWPVLDAKPSQNLSPALADRLKELQPGNVIAHIGEGSFLKAEIASEPGRRDVWEDKDGLISETYRTWPAYPTVMHYGETDSHRVALTFDDGPDPEWTPKILDILKQYGVKATFFIIGRHGEDHPDLVRRILQEGHEIGSHTYTHPNLSEAGENQITLELNATQRLVEWLTGRTTLLFRPPYNADTMPGSLPDVLPISLATDLGYLTVGESIDPQDWARPGTDEILRRVRNQRREGNVILLHDAGGDREQTVAALPLILEYLRERGDTIVPAGELTSLSRDQSMPALNDGTQNTPRLIANAGLMTLHWSEELLWAFMIAASLLAILRSGLLAVLALSRKKDRRLDPASPVALSVVIAAYNEGKVIAHTLQSVLRTDYGGLLEVIVVDDGSTDDTADRVSAMAAGESRIRLVRQANKGKASALAHGSELAKHEILVFLDADTQFQPDTLRKLVRPFADAEVGAISGHARVGNLRGWVARFQSLEYICGFNLDRRAYDRLNAITVVPGAISAFRRQAILEAGGFGVDTIAEDTDLTLALHRADWRVTYAPEAIAWTEAPETLRALAKQRFRWAFGTMQCIWKHRDLFFDFRRPGLGWFSLPSIVLFQIFLVASVPIADFLLIVSLFSGAGWLFVGYFFAFLICDVVLALIACGIEKEPLHRAAWIIPMRFVYRPVLSYVVWSAILQMLKGAWVGWGKLDRTGSVQIDHLAKELRAD